MDGILRAVTTDYSSAAEFYDLLYSGRKDYAAEAPVIAGLIRERAPAAKTVLDVACGTGRHAEELTKLGFAVDGIDLEPQFIGIAALRNPAGRFDVADMATFELGRKYDAILCMFSAIGYVLTVEALNATVKRFAAHLSPGGVMIVEGWFEPGQLTHRKVDAFAQAANGVAVGRMARTYVEGKISRLEFNYLIGRAEGVEHRSETHRLGLFTQDEMESAFRSAGLRVERRRGVMRDRGVYVGQWP
jgi:SAM-dependent methyltransferase